jgi:hypothetical protein
MVSASQGTSTSGITIIWNAASGASSYSVYRGTSSTSSTATLIKSGATTTSWIDTPPVNGTNYYYWVSASGSSGTSTGEGVLSSTYKSGYTKMTAPTISATAAGFGLINVSWTTVQNAQWYYLYVDGDTTTPYRTYDSSQTSDALSFAYYSSHYFAVSVAGEQSGSVSALSSWTPSVSVY